MMFSSNNLTSEVSTKSSFDNLPKSKSHENKFFSEKNAYSFTPFSLFVSRSSNKLLNHEINVLLETKKRPLLDNLKKGSSLDKLMGLRRLPLDNLKKGSPFDNLRGLSLSDNLIVGFSIRPSLNNLTSIEDLSKGMTSLKSDKRPRDFKNDRRDFAFEVFQFNQEAQLSIYQRMIESF